jgi:UDP-glucuronate decarboxylase
VNDHKNPLRQSLYEDLLMLTDGYSIPWVKLKGKAVLITGASGFLAGYLIETLVYFNDTYKMNVRIVLLGRARNNFQQKFTGYIEREDVSFIEQDVCSPINLDFKLDYIIHAASQASPKFYNQDPVGTLSANTIGTQMLLELAKSHKVDGFLYFSSAEVYGDATNIPTKEVDYGRLDPLDVRSCYAESKRMGENMCVAWHHQYDVPVKIVRPFHTYGPGMKLDDGRVYADFVACVVKGKDIEIKSNGLARRSFCYIADATAGFWMVLLKGVNAEAYNIGNPEGEISISNLATLIANLDANNVSVKFKHRKSSESYMPSQVSVICPDISKAANLGWVPRTSLEDGFRKTIESYRI